MKSLRFPDTSAWIRYYPVLLMVIVVVFFWPLVSMSMSMRWDATNIYLPWKYHITECIKNGLLPLWNPSIQCGFPQMGDPGTWYPVSWLIGMAFPRFDFAALNLEFLIHLLIGGIGCYQVANRYKLSHHASLMLAISYMCSGFFISQAQHLGWIVSAAWIPWCYTYTLRLAKTLRFHDAIFLSIFLFLLFTGGYPGLSIVTAYVLLTAFIIYFLPNLRRREITLKRATWMIPLVLILFILYSLPALMGVWELFHSVTRNSGLGQTGALAYHYGSLSANGLLSLVFPYALTTDNPAFWVEDTSLLNTYFGILPLILVVLTFIEWGKSNKGWVYGLIGIFFLMASMATVFPVRAWMYQLLPFMDLFRFPSLFRIFAILFLLLGAGHAIDHLFSNEKTLKRFKILLISFPGIFLILMLCLYVSGSIDNISLFFKDIDEFQRQGSIAEKVFLQAGIHVLLTGFLLMGFILRQTISIRKSLLLVILVADMGIAVRLNFYASVADPISMKPAQEAFQQLPCDFPHPSVSQAMVEITDQRYYHTLPLTWRNVPVFHKMPSPESYNPYTLQSTQEAVLSGAYMQAIQHPFLFIQADQKTLDQDDLVIDNQIHIKGYSPQLLQLEVMLAENGELVVVQNHHPRWHAWVNGEEKIPQKVYDTFMGLYLPAGKHFIQFEFKAADIYFALLVSLILLVISSGILIHHYILSLPANRRWLWYTVIVILLLLYTVNAFMQFAKRDSKHAVAKAFTDLLNEIEVNQENKNNTALIINADREDRFEYPAFIPSTHHLRVNHEMDFCALQESLVKDSSEYLIYAQRGTIRFPWIKPLLLNYYPEILEEKSDGNGYMLFARKIISPDQAREVKISKDNAGQVIPLLQGAHIPDAMLDLQTAYSETYSWAWKDIYRATGGKLSVQCVIQAGQGAELGIVAQTETGGETMSWQMEEIGKFNCRPLAEVPVSYALDLRLIRNPGDSLRIYFWNVNGIPSTIKQVRFSRAW